MMAPSSPMRASCLTRRVRRTGASAVGAQSGRGPRRTASPLPPPGRQPPSLLPAMTNVLVAPIRAALGSADSASRLILLGPDHAIERIGRLVNQGFRIVHVRMKVLEGKIAAIAGLVECFEHRRPVGRAIEKRPERFQRRVGSLLRELL